MLRKEKGKKTFSVFSLSLSLCRVSLSMSIEFSFLCIFFSSLLYECYLSFHLCFISISIVNISVPSLSKVLYFLLFVSRCKSGNAILSRSLPFRTFFPSKKAVQSFLYQGLDCKRTKKPWFFSSVSFCSAA